MPEFIAQSPISVGNGPIRAACDPVLGKVFVSNYPDGTVSVIEVATSSVIATIGVGTNPYGIACDSVLGKTFVCNYGDGTVSIINSDTHAVLATIQGGVNPGMPTAQVACDESLGKTWISNYQNTTSLSVRVINSSTHALISDIDYGFYPFGIDIDETLQVALSAHSIYGRVRGHDSDTLAYINFIQLAGTVRVVGCTENTGKGYVSSRQTPGLVYIVNTALLTSPGSITMPGDLPEGVACADSIRVVFVANTDMDTVSVISTATDTIIDTLNVGNDPYGIAVNETAKRLYVTNYNGGGAGTVSEFLWKTGQPQVMWFSRH